MTITDRHCWRYLNISSAKLQETKESVEKQGEDRDKIIRAKLGKRNRDRVSQTAGAMMQLAPPSEQQKELSNKRKREASKRCLLQADPNQPLPSSTSPSRKLELPIPRPTSSTALRRHLLSSERLARSTKIISWITELSPFSPSRTKRERKARPTHLSLPE